MAENGLIYLYGCGVTALLWLLIFYFDDWKSEGTSLRVEHVLKWILLSFGSWVICGLTLVGVIMSCSDKVILKNSRENPHAKKNMSDGYRH